MAHAGDRTAFRRGAHGALDRSRLGLAELPPAVGAPSIPVTAVGGDLDTWHDDRQTVAPRTVGELMGDVVVIGHAEDIEPGIRGPEQHLLRPAVAVGVHGVAVEVRAQPPRSPLGKRLSTDATGR